MGSENFVAIDVMQEESNLMIEGLDIVTDAYFNGNMDTIFFSSRPLNGCNPGYNKRKFATLIIGAVKT